jgi:hypothetical protein
MLIAERLWARMGRPTANSPDVKQPLAALAQPDTTGRLVTPFGTGLAERLANEAAFQALEEARALAAEAQQDRVAAQAAWLEADRIKAELAAISAAHAARSVELDSHAHLLEMRERELENTLREVAVLKAEYESKLAALEAIVKGPARQA